MRGAGVHMVTEKAHSWSELEVIKSLDGYVVIGHPDAYDPVTKSLYDYKNIFSTRRHFYRVRRGKPILLEHFVRQVHYYTHLLRLHGLPVEHIFLVYFFDDCWEIHEVPEDNLQDSVLKIEAHIAAVRLAEKHNEVPPCTEGWWCKTCHWRRECMSQNIGQELDQPSPNGSPVVARRPGREESAKTFFKHDVQWGETS